MPTIKTYRKVGAFYIAWEEDFSTSILTRQDPVNVSIWKRRAQRKVFSKSIKTTLSGIWARTTGSAGIATAAASP